MHGNSALDVLNSENPLNELRIRVSKNGNISIDTLTEILA